MDFSPLISARGNLRECTLAVNQTWGFVSGVDSVD
jgi:hypothetical protein